MTRQGTPGTPVYMDGSIWFESSAAAARMLLGDYGIRPTQREVNTMGSNIGRAANGGAKTAYGHTWTRERRGDGGLLRRD